MNKNPLQYYDMWPYPMWPWGKNFSGTLPPPAGKEKERKDGGGSLCFAAAEPPLVWERERIPYVLRVHLM